MAFLGSIGKFLGNVAKPLIRAVPAALTGFATGGKAGALTGALGSLQAGAGSAPSIFSGVQTSFSQPVTRLPSFPADGGMQTTPTMAAVPALTKPVFEIILKLAARLGIAIKSPRSVVRIGRNIIAKLLRFARANPGLTIISLLTNLGLTLFEANEIITWWTTHGKRHRRIRVTNVKALNRSVRRLEGFRRLSHRVETALARRGVSARPSSRRRCPRCRKSPCCC